MRKTIYPIETITLTVTFKLRTRDMHDRGDRYTVFIGQKHIALLFPPNIDNNKYCVFDCTVAGYPKRYLFSSEKKAKNYCIRIGRQFISKLK